MKQPRIVIVGASLAGATAAASLRDEGFDGEIRLIGAERQPPYNRPPLSKGYLRREEGFEALLVKPAGYYTEQRIDLTLGVRATSIDAKQKLVALETGERVAYDRLLVTTGGRNATWWWPGSGSCPTASCWRRPGPRSTTVCSSMSAAEPHCRTCSRRATSRIICIRSSAACAWSTGTTATSRDAPPPGPWQAATSPTTTSIPSGRISTSTRSSTWGFAASWDRLVFRGRPERRKFLGFYLKDWILRAAVSLDRGGDPEDPKGEAELKAAVELIRSRVAVDPAKLSDEGFDLRRVVKD